MVVKKSVHNKSRKVMLSPMADPGIQLGGHIMSGIQTFS